MTPEERLKLITRNTVEIVTLEELRSKIEAGEKLKGYLGFEPSGLFHIGWLVWANKVKDLVDAGIEFYLLAATWHAWINDKLGGDMELIRKAARHVVDVLEAIGVDKAKLKVVDAEDLVSDKEYWAILLRVAKNNTLARIKRALTIMGRRAEEAELDFSKLIYPAMQVTDIFYLDLDIALGGLDQRKAHMLARDTAEKLGRKKPIAIHTPLLTGLQGIGRMNPSMVDEEQHAVEFKMSKSKPETAVFVYDSPEDIEKKILRAYCPAREVKFNPIMEINKYLLFARPGFKLVIERPEKYGGTIIVESYEELEKLYIEGRLHPLDLKKATAKALIEMLEPVRRYFEQNREARETLEELKKAAITR
ncbi:Tyrosyl-tRNA synthetase [Pyrodictium delaneyi]|uniref:Tyrosine--tRNA ligase n=1 Tax=Pyrodictium delaneyi TaxID=1273541 RepID=A0A0P0N5C2_9CREN|nr:tyrosine--tRNA ligase [Pyrodictium delaneyi]ALL01670.1 Tyrosyl-tRNA synthetase [Pyrodictium delaneyi]OWJ55236.1 tyrosine--tRNA ligase [Pyrodictium delaneyi]